MNIKNLLVLCISLILVMGCVGLADFGNFFHFSLTICVAASCIAQTTIKYRSGCFALVVLLALYSIYLSKTTSPSSLVLIPAVLTICLMGSLLITYIRPEIVRILRLGLCVIILMTSIPTLLLNKIINNEPNRAILNNGKWAYTDPGSKKLNIKSQYSYNILQATIQADEINLGDIGKYEELWIITPTKPFSKTESEALHKWLRGGGRMVIIADHTDLFGHQRVLNRFIEELGVSVSDGAIIGTDGGGGIYRSARGNYNGLTATTFSGDYIPTHYALGYDDGIDYSKPSFFSDFRITSEDRFSAYPCSGLKKVGMGQILLFGDSTLFSNFGLSRPGSQHLLREICSGTYPHPSYTVFIVAIIAVLALNLRSGIYYFIPLLLFFIWLCAPVFDKTAQLAWPEPHIKALGNWNIAEFGDQYATPLAASYALSPSFPVWSNVSTDSDYIILGDRKIYRRELFHRHIDYNQMIESMGGNLTKSTREILGLSEEIDYERLHYGTFWFANGIGPIRENIFSRFWGMPNQLSIQGTSEELVCRLISKETKEKLLVNAYQIDSDPDWFILGNGIVAKRLSDKLLIRKQWQAIPYHGIDFVLEIKQ